MRSHPAVVAVLALAALPIGAPAAWAADRPSKPLVLTLIGSDAVLGVTDTGAKGPTPGDLRTLSLALSSTGGKAMGRAEIVQVLTRQDAAGGTAVKTVVLNLAKGTISIMGTTDFADITDPASRPNDSTEHLAIVGGTGAYRGASGSVDIEVLPLFRSRWTLSISAQ